MRSHRQLVLYQSLLQVLQESGCPFCRFLKEYQTARLQNHSKESIHPLCNFHAWGLAAVQDAPQAAQVFINLVDRPDFLSDTECDICREVLAEEELRVSEFVSCPSRTEVSDWLRNSAVLCVPHGEKLQRQVPPALAARVNAVVEKCRRQLAHDLQQLRDEPESEKAGWGALGRAAEFLVSQRGLHS